MESMRAHQYAPITPLHTEPLGPVTSMVNRREALLDALRGVEFGRYDQRLVDWLVGHLDNSALRGLVSLIARSRAAAIADAVEAEHYLRTRPRRPQVRAVGRAEPPDNRGRAY